MLYFINFIHFQIIIVLVIPVSFVLDFTCHNLAVLCFLYSLHHTLKFMNNIITVIISSNITIIYKIKVHVISFHYLVVQFLKSMQIYIKVPLYVIYYQDM